MSNAVRKGIAVVCGIFLVLGIVFSVYSKDKELIGTVIVFAIVYAIYLIVLSKKLKADAGKEKKALPKRK